MFLLLLPLYAGRLFNRCGMGSDVSANRLSWQQVSCQNAMVIN